MDKAFGFYYPDDLKAFEDSGATLVKIDALKDPHLPESLDGLFIGGGFPERHAKELSANHTLRQQIHDKIITGLPCYAECGGLMYLSQSIQWHETDYKMVGVIEGKSKMHSKPQGRGYVKLQRTHQHCWHEEPQPQSTQQLIHAHEFHYSSLEHLPTEQRFAYEVKRGSGIDNLHDGLIIYNLLASYTHMRNTQHNPWVSHFLNFVSKHRDANAN